MTLEPGDAPRSATANADKHPPRTIRELREALPAHQQRLFDAELARTEIEAVPATLNRWLTLGIDGFEEFLLSTPFEGLEFGSRSYDAETQCDDLRMSSRPANHGERIMPMPALTLPALVLSDTQAAGGGLGPPPAVTGLPEGSGYRVKWKIPHVTWLLLPPSTQLVRPFFMWAR